MFLFHIVVPSVYPAGCDNFVLTHDYEHKDKGKVTVEINNGNETVISILPNTQNTRIWCTCAQKDLQNTKWLFSNGTEVSSKSGNNRRIHYRMGGTVLFIPKSTPSLEYVGVYRCTSMNDSIRVILKGDD